MFKLDHGQWGVDLSNGQTAVYGVCVITGKEYGIPGVPTPALRKWWQDGELIDQVMPDVPAEDREFLLSGISPEGWASLDLGEE